jgi:dipeptidyl aminopeptidase/acylaminoacyl peptidase
LTAQDYARAERFLAPGVADLVLHEVERPEWQEDGRLRYRTRTAEGQVDVVVDPATGTREVIVEDSAGGRAGASHPEPDPRSSRDMVISPDGRLAAFIRDHDLWVRVLETGDELALTTDGIEHYGYATNNAGWTRSDRPVVRWSPDSRKIATFRHDARGVGEMYLTTTEVGHPELDAWRYPLPEDTVIFRIERLIIDLGQDPGARSGPRPLSVEDLAPRLVWLDMTPDPHRSTVCDHVYCRGTFTDVEWSEDGSELTFVSSSRDHKRATLRVADAETGEVRTVLEEIVPTFYESGYRTYNWRFLPDEIVWYSRESDWGHLYLHDLDTGARQHAITEGDWNVLQVRRLDPESRTVWFVGNEREAGDPYFHYFYRASLDGDDVTLLTPDSAHHQIELSPDGRYFLDRWSTPTTPAIAVIRDAWTGEIVMELERADASRLLATGWRSPVPFTVKARDGETDLFGLLYRPTDFDSSWAYPVINYIYPGPQSGSVGSRSFSAARRDHQAMAELGFVVVALDAMGTPQRSRSFHEAYYGNMGDNGLPDQIGGIRQLADRHPWIDVERVGVWGHSGGGFASASAIFRYPGFYKVAVSQAGNHDNRNYEDDWGEKWQGLLEERTGGGTTYDNQANQLVAHNLRGKLLLAHGMMDDNVPPYNTLLVVEALIDANEDFDLILFPGARHGFAMHPYMIRRRWDHFVEHLLGAEPPAEYTIGKSGR